MDDMKTKAEVKSDVAVEATTAAQQAVEEARVAQMKEGFQNALETFFSRGVDEKRFIDVGRIPFICDDLRGIHATLESMRNDMKWAKYIGGGFVIAAGMLALKALGI